MKTKKYILSILLILAALLLTGGVLWAVFRDPDSPVPDVMEPSSEEEQEEASETSSAEESEESTVPESSSSEESEEDSEEEPAPEPEPEPTLAEKTLADMTLREKLCQLFVVLPNQITGVYSQQQAGEATQAALAEYPVGGMLLDATNISSIDQITVMNQNLQAYSRIPLLLTIDEEGGRVARLMSAAGTTWVGSMLSYEEQGPDTARENARIIAQDITSCGFNLDFAPVADVWSNPDNTVIGDRTYSTDFATAAELVAAAVEGFHAGGAACTLKHFPGHGSTTEDSHLGSAYVYRTLDEIRAEELLPFKAGIEAGADCVMIGHLILTEVDERPAPFSSKIVTDLLRTELGFDGVVITDALQMQALSDHYSSGEVATMCIQAGCDLLLCPVDLDAAIQALEAAVTDGTITEERIDESVLRVLHLKEKMGLTW